MAGSFAEARAQILSLQPAVLRGLRDGAKIVQVTEHVRRLHHDARRFTVDQGRQILQSVRPRRRRDGRVVGEPRHRCDRVAVVRMQIAGEHRLAPPGDAVRHQHGLGGGGRAVIHGGIRHLHAGQHGHLGLEFEQVLQRALGDFRLIRRV
jgi:hypothetical protein